MPSKNTIAILGSGKMAKVHFECYRKHPQVDRIVFWGRNRDALSKLSSRYRNSAVYLDFNEMLQKENILAMSVCVPPHMRFDLIDRALKNGCHILCEKPSSLSVEEAEKMAETAENVNRIFMVGYTLRFLPEYIKVKKIIESGEIGEVKAVYFRIGRGFRKTEWMIDPSRSFGILSELGIHGIDLARSFINDKIELAKGEVICSVDERRVADNGGAVLKFQQGAIAVISCSLSYPFFENDLAVIGTIKSIRVSRGHVFVKNHLSEDSLSRLFAGFLLEGLYFPYQYLLQSPYRSEIDYFLKCVNDNVLPETNIRNDIETLRVCLSLQKQYEETVKERGKTLQKQ